LFDNYPLLHQAYKHTLEFRSIYEETSKGIANNRMLQWIEKTKGVKMTVFNTAAKSVNYHLETILIFFYKSKCKRRIF
jgi:hypothetical protein